MSSCWNCHLESFDPNFCSHCGKIQPLIEDTDYFEFLGFKELLNVNRDELEKKFYNLSKKFHPDFYQNGTEKEREYSLDKASYLNRAYSTLKDPFSRAKYMLELLWGDRAEKERKNIPPELLMEIMDLHEMIDAMTHDPDPVSRRETGKEITRIRKELASKSSALENELITIFKKWDTVIENLNGKKLLCEEHQNLLKQMSDVLTVRSYLDTLIHSIETETGEEIS